MTFKKGQSGNPGGRPKELGDIRELARAHTTAAIETLVRALDAKSEQTRVTAAEALLSRGWGKPQQSVEMSGKDGAPLPPTRIELVAGVKRTD